MMCDGVEGDTEQVSVERQGTEETVRFFFWGESQMVSASQQTSR